MSNVLLLFCSTLAAAQTGVGSNIIAFAILK